MSFAKLQLDIMTLGGLVIAIGMMVDSSIVVSIGKLLQIAGKRA